VCFGARGTRLRELVRVAGARWAIEESFQTAKNEVGLDQYQVRRYDAWYAHIPWRLDRALPVIISDRESDGLSSVARAVAPMPGGPMAVLKWHPVRVPGPRSSANSGTIR
jgi:hypothetical protein